MVELVAVGRTYRAVLDYLGRVNDRANIIVYPEFFDSKKCLINRYDVVCLKNYIRQVWANRDRIIVAVYPDYRGVLRLPEDIVYVYPVHEEEDWNRLLRVEGRYMVVPGYPRGLTYMGVYGFVREASGLGFKKWLMGLTPRYLKYVGLFDYVDVTTYSIPGFNHEKIRREGAETLYMMARSLVEAGEQDAHGLHGVYP